MNSKENKYTKLRIGKYNIILSSICAWHHEYSRITFYLNHGGTVIVPITDNEAATKINELLDFLESQHNTFSID